MHTRRKTSITTYFLVSLFFPIFLFGQNYEVVGYLPKRSVHRMTDEHFKLITSVIYFGMDADGEGNILSEPCREDLRILDSLRKDKNVRISVCFGGWDRSDFFPEMTGSRKKRENFCRQALSLCLEYGLSGVDLDWEYPKNKRERKNFVKFLRELNHTLGPYGLGITIAVGHWEEKVKLTLAAEKYLEAVNVMLYDNGDAENGHASMKLVKEGTGRFLEAGIPAEKIMVGVPFYGRHRTERQKTMAYRELKDPDRDVADDGWYQGYFFNPPIILKKKAEYVKEMGFRGIMIWELGHDVDPVFPHSLLKSVSEAMLD